MIRLRSKAWLGLVVVFGCVQAPDSINDTSDDISAGSRGVDYSFARPSPSGIRAAGYTFAARYLSYDSSKDISASEANALWAAGVDIVANWEAGSQDALEGYSKGVAEAQQAQSEAVAAGMPATRPIYFSVDFDATPGQQAALNSYFDGVASVIGRDRTGAYGGYYPISRLFDAGKIAWGWQAYAWSGGLWDARAQVRQVQNGVTVGGGACDLDTAEASDIGQWHASSTTGGGSAGVKRLAVAENADGRLEVFWMGPDGALFHIWQTTAGGGWSPAEPLGGAAKEVVVAENADGRLELFYVGTNNVLYHNWQKTAGGAWSGQASFGIDGIDLAIGKNIDGRLELAYASPSDSSISHIWQTTAGGGWSPGEPLGGAAKNLVIGNHADGALDVIYVGTNNGLYHRFQTAPGGGWGSEVSLGPVATDLAVARNLDGRLELVYPEPTTGAIDHSWETAPNAGFTGASALGGEAKQVAFGINADGRLETVYVGTNNVLYHRWQTVAGGGWSGEASLGVSGTAVTMTTNKDGRLEVFYSTPSNALAHLWQTAAGGAWSGGYGLGGSVEPTAQ